jgi:hypothetical protein
MASLVPTAASVKSLLDNQVDKLYATKNEMLPPLSSTKLAPLALCHLLDDLRIEGE